MFPETKHFPIGTLNPVFTETKTSLHKETQRLAFVPIYQHMQLNKVKAIHMLHTALCMLFNLCFARIFLLGMLADLMRVMNIIKYGTYSFYFHHNLTVSFPRHCAQYVHYIIRQLSAATCCQFTVLTWLTVLTANWRGEVTTESDER